MAVWTINWRREREGRQTRGEAIAIIWVLRRSTLKTNTLLFISDFVGEKIISQHPSSELCEVLSLLGPLFWIIFHGQASPQGLRKCPAVDKDVSEVADRSWPSPVALPEILLFPDQLHPGFPFSNIENPSLRSGWWDGKRNLGCMEIGDCWEPGPLIPSSVLTHNFYLILDSLPSNFGLFRHLPDMEKVIPGSCKGRRDGIVQITQGIYFQTWSWNCRGMGREMYERARDLL